MIGKYFENKPFIFVSYKHDAADEAVVRKTISELRRRFGFNIWYDAELTAGTNWDAIALRRVRSSYCKMVLLFASNAALTSRPISEELATAKKWRKMIIPISFENRPFSEILMTINEEYNESDPDKVDIADRIIEEHLDDKLTYIVADVNSDSYYNDIFRTVSKNAPEIIESAEKADQAEENDSDVSIQAESAAPKEPLSEPEPATAPEDPSVVPPQNDPSSSESGTASAKSEDSQKEPDGKEDRKPEDEAVPDPENGRREEEDSGERKQKQYTATGDITFTLYGREYTYNQSDMMLTFFAQVLNRHQECVEGLLDRGGMNCASAVDYTKKENRTEEMPSYFRVCQYFEFDSGCGVCIGTAYGVNDKLKKMAMLLDICGEDPSVFSSEQVELPEVGSGKGRNAAIMTYRVYGKSFSSSQTEMMGNIFREVIERHPDKLQELADQLMCVAVSDYSKVPKKERPVYFASLCVYDLKGTTYSIGGTFGMAEKLRQIAKLLDICEVDKSEVEIEGYELPEAGKRKKTNIRYF